MQLLTNNQLPTHIMIQTVEIKSSDSSELQGVTNYRKLPDAAELEKSVRLGIPPEGYLTVDKFFSNVKNRLKKYYEDNGLLK